MLMSNYKNISIWKDLYILIMKKGFAVELEIVSSGFCSGSSLKVPSS